MSRVFRYDILEEIVIPDGDAFLKGVEVAVIVPSSYNLLVAQVINCTAHDGKKHKKYAGLVTSVQSVPGDDTAVSVSLKKP